MYTVLYLILYCIKLHGSNLGEKIVTVFFIFSSEPTSCIKALA